MPDRDRVDIAYLVSHGFAARMVVQTGLLGRLREAGQRVAVVTPDPSDPMLSAYCRTHGIDLHGFDVRGNFADENYMFKRKYFLEDVEANPALMDKHVHAVRYATSRHPLRRLRPHYYWQVYRLRKLVPTVGERITARFTAREKKYLRSDVAEALVSRLRPRKIVSTYPCNFNEAVLLHYGNQHPEVETWTHLLSWDNITAKGRFPATADRYVAWGPVMRDELIHHYAIDSSRICICGVPHFDLHVQTHADGERADDLMSLGLDPEQPYLFFGMSAPRFAPAEIDVVEWLAAEVEAGTFGSEMQLVVRPHPQNVQGNMADTSWLGRLDALSRLGRTAVDLPRMAQSRLSWSTEPDDMLRLAHLIGGAAAVLNSGSTISIDALMHDRPVVITAFDGARTFDYWRSARRLVDYTHIAKLIGFGGIEVARDYEGLATAVRDAIEHPDTRRDARRAAVRAECNAADGRATERVVACLTAD